MGNQTGRGHITGKKGNAAASSSATGQSNAADSHDCARPSEHDEQPGHAQFLPIDRLAKILSSHSHQEHGCHAITSDVFARYLFPHRVNLATRLFEYLRHCANHQHSSSSSSTPASMTVAAFKLQTERFLAVMNDEAVLENYVRMHSNEAGDVTRRTLQELLVASYQLAFVEDERCDQLEAVLEAVVSSCFHGKATLSTSYVSSWILEHCPRLTHGIHRYVVHVLTTAYRNGSLLLSTQPAHFHFPTSTPVIDKPKSDDIQELPGSFAWILSTSLPLRYIEANEPDPKSMVNRMSAVLCPSHWTLLYRSDQHGCGANRFLHHVLGYRGPSVLVIRTSRGERTLCVCSGVEWRESHGYWGDDTSVILEMLPSYRILRRGPKLLYLNTSIRGYPQGLRAGDDPRNPVILIDDAFQSVTVSGAAFEIGCLEVWGCGDTKSRERQLEIKKWQVKEAERQRIVKLSATDWLDHPDRYLLELAGRTSYNNSN